MTKIGFRSGEFVDSVSYGLCSKRSGSGWGSQGVSSIFLEGIGGPGGIACSLTCPGGEAMYKVTVKYGSFVDSIRAECRR